MCPFFPGPPLSVSVGSRGRAASLAVSWAAGGPGRPSHLLRLSRLGPLGTPEGQQLQAHTNASSFEFQDLVPGSHYRLEVTVLHPCGQNATTILTAHTGAWRAGWGAVAGRPGGPSRMRPRRGQGRGQGVRGARGLGGGEGGVGRVNVKFSEDHAWTLTLPRPQKHS